MHLRLRNGLHFCDCAGTIVFLDVRADRYFALSGKADQAFRAWIAGEVTVGGPDQHLNSLISTGLLVPEAGEDKVGWSSPPERATRDFQPQPVGRAWLVGVQAFLLRYLAGRKLRSQSLNAVLRAVRERKAALTACAHEAADEISLVCSAFDSAR